MNKMKLLEQYTEENYSIEELTKIFADRIHNARKQGICLEFITQKPIYNEKGEVIGTTTDFPAELNIYRVINKSLE